MARLRPDSTPEHLHDLDPQPQIALIVADHAFTTEQQRAQMINVDMCAASQSQKRGEMLINAKTESFDKRTSMTASGDQKVVTSFIDASVEKPPMYDVVRAVMHSHRLSMTRMNIITFSSDCATNCTSAASDCRVTTTFHSLRGSDGDKAHSADKVAISTLKFLHRARAERDYLLSTMH